MDANQLPDMPWHIGFVKKDEWDPHRHKARAFTPALNICRLNCQTNNPTLQFNQGPCGPRHATPRTSWKPSCWVSM